MSKIITKKLEFVWFLTDSKQITNLPQYSNIDKIWKISLDGLAAESWDSASLFNAFDTLEKFELYCIFSKNTGYILYEEPDQTPPLDPLVPRSSILLFCDLFYTNNNSRIFDKTSWTQPFNISTNKWSKWKQYLDRSANRWAHYIDFDSQVFQSIKNIDSMWNGIKLNNIYIYNDPSSNSIAACGPYEYVDLLTDQEGVKFNTYSFDLYINEYFENMFDDCDWVNILTHELGHALGIGVYWDNFFESQGAVVPINNFLSGSAYQNSQIAYNQIANLNRNFVPLEDSGGEGTVGSHWEMDYRTKNSEGYPGFEDELMIGYYSEGSNFVISSLSIKVLVDFGYVENYPGINEGIPFLVNNISIRASNLGIKLDCFHTPKPKRFAVINKK